MEWAGGAQHSRGGREAAYAARWCAGADPTGGGPIDGGPIDTERRAGGVVRGGLSVPALWCGNLADIPGLTGFGIWMQRNPNSRISERPRGVRFWSWIPPRRAVASSVSSQSPHSVALGSFQDPRGAYHRGSCALLPAGSVLVTSSLLAAGRASPPSFPVGKGAGITAGNREFEPTRPRDSRVKYRGR